jgi:hypothetical protein
MNISTIFYNCSLNYSRSKKLTITRIRFGKISFRFDENNLRLTELNWTELDWTELDWTELD